MNRNGARAALAQRPTLGIPATPRVDESNSVRLLGWIARTASGQVPFAWLLAYTIDEN